MPLGDPHPNTTDLPTIDPPDNYPAPNAAGPAEEPVVVQVTADHVAEARHRVDQLRADVEGNLEHVAECLDRCETAHARLTATADRLGDDRALLEVAQDAYASAADDVDTARRLLEAAEQHLDQLEAVTAQPDPCDRVDQIARTLHAAGVTAYTAAGDSPTYRRMAQAVLERFDAEHAAALTEQAGRLAHAHQAELEQAHANVSALLDRLAAE